MHRTTTTIIGGMPIDMTTIVVAMTGDVTMIVGGMMIAEATKIVVVTMTGAIATAGIGTTGGLPRPRRPCWSCKAGSKS